MGLGPASASLVLVTSNAIIHVGQAATCSNVMPQGDSAYSVKKGRGGAMVSEYDLCPVTATPPAGFVHTSLMTHLKGSRYTFGTCLFRSQSHRLSDPAHRDIMRKSMVANDPSLNPRTTILAM